MDPKIELWPAQCPGNGGHVWAGIVIGWKPCTCITWKQPAGHRTYWCLTCDFVVHVPLCLQKSRAIWDNGLTPPNRMGSAE